MIIGNAKFGTQQQKRDPDPNSPTTPPPKPGAAGAIKNPFKPEAQSVPDPLMRESERSTVTPFTQLPTPSSLTPTHTHTHPHTHTHAHTHTHLHLHLHHSLVFSGSL